MNRIVLLAGLLLAAQAAGAASALTVPTEAPAGTPKFAGRPYPADVSPTIASGWYYPGGSGYPSYCDYQNIAGYPRHCAVDYLIYKDGRYLTFPILAVGNGTARRFDNNLADPGRSNRIDLTLDRRLPDGRAICVRYLHMDNRPVGQVTGTTAVRVTKGQQIAWVGNSGTTNPHLHLEFFAGACNSRTPRFDPYDIALDRIRLRVPPTKDRYPGGVNFGGCGAEHVWSAASGMCP